MSASLAIIGAPTSARAYAPGQEKIPDTIRAAGLISLLEAHGVYVIDKGNVPGIAGKLISKINEP